jgi:hypothetical protein
MHQGVRLFSFLYGGTPETWRWLCAVSNGRSWPLPELNAQQRAYALRLGYVSRETGETT